MAFNFFYFFILNVIFSQSAKLGYSDEVFAAIRIDSHHMAKTEAKSISNRCWDEHFNLNLDKV